MFRITFIYSNQLFIGNDLNNYMVSGGDKDPDEMIASGTRLVE